MLLLSIALWGIVLFSFRVAFLGDPVYQHVAETDDHILDKAQKIISSRQSVPAGEDEIHFLKRFSRLTILEVAVFLLELAILGTLCYMMIVPWVAGALLAKDLLVVIVSFIVAKKKTSEKGIFTSVTDLPRWLIRADRFSAFISGAGCLFLFIYVNVFMPLP